MALSQTEGAALGDTMAVTDNTNTKKKRETCEGHLNRVNNRIDRLAEQRPSHKQVLKFLKDVLTEQFGIKPGIKTHPVPMDEKLIKTKTAEGFPLVDKGDLKLDIASATNLFEGLCGVLKRNSKVSGDIDKIEHAISGEEINLEELFKKTAVQNGDYVASLSDRLNLKRAILSFLAENSLRPIFEAYADELKGYVDQEKWWRAYCPICGSKPVMAELIGPERKKFLVCSCCGYEWRFTRTRCPFCEKAEPKGLKFFLTKEEGKAYRVETCRKCKKYIKTVDTNELHEELVPMVEDIGTLYLDVLAKKEGYTRDVHPLGLNLEDL